MTTLSASPGNAYGDDGMPCMNTTTEVQWFCDNTYMCGLPAFLIGVAGILFFLISCIVWCYIYRTRLCLNNHHTTEEGNAGKELTEVISNNPTLNEEAIEYQIETTRRYEKDPTQKLCTQTKAYDEYENVRSTDVANGDRKKIKEKLCTPTKACDEYDYVRTDVTNGGTIILKEKLCTQTKAYDEYENVRSTDVANGDRKKIKEKLCTPTKACDEYDYVRTDVTNGGTTILKEKLCTQTKAYDEYENVRSTDVANGDRKKIKEKLCTPTKACDEYDYVRADVTNGGTTILKEKLCTQTKAYDEYENVRSTDVANGDRKKIKEKLCTPTKACDEYDYVRAEVTNGGTTILKEIPTVDTYSNENEMHIHSDLKKKRCLGNVKECTSISDLGPLGNTPIASEDEKINTPSSVKGQKVNDTKTYPQLFPELTREFNQKYGKAKSEDVDCSGQYDNFNALSIEDPDNRMLVHDKELSKIVVDVHSHRTRDFDDDERMESPHEILPSQEDIQGTFNPVYENVDTSDNRESSDSSNSDELCSKGAGVHVYKPRGHVQVTITKNYFGQKSTNYHKATGAN